MSKAILVIDMPTCCKECRPFYDTEILPSCWAAMNFKGRTVVYNETEIQHFCPLKPLPTKKTEEPFVVDIFGNVHSREEDLFAKGYNACLKDILGEEYG